MKAKTINLVIQKKVNEWIATLPEELQKKVKNNIIVTGGCIPSMLLREKVNDFDIYFRTNRVAYDVACHYVRLFKEGSKHDIETQWDSKPEGRVKIVVKSAGVASETDPGEYKYFEMQPPDEAGTYASEVFNDIEEAHEGAESAAINEEDEKYRPVFLTTNAITLSNKVQLIFRFTGSANEIHKNYDFVHCTNYWTPACGLLLQRDALESILTKELRYVGSKYPVCSIIRMRKFINRGWTINAGQIFKMIYQCGELDLNDLNVLEDQLTGVDVAYFMEVIRALQKKDSERVDKAYLMEIIERIF